jgi:hypothetical protein
MARMIEKSRPNGWPLSLQEFDDGENKLWVVFEGLEDNEVDEIDFETYAAAKLHYDARKASLATTPNWEAQARYDEEHGTDNGYDPRIERFRDEY